MYNVKFFNDSINESTKLGFDNDIDLGFNIYIPRLEARGEKEYRSHWSLCNDMYNDKSLTPNDVYSFFVRPQYGTSENRCGHIFFLVLPKSQKALAIYLYPDKGYIFDKTLHTEFINEYDTLDRNIIRSFVEKYQDNFRKLCSLQIVSNITPYSKNELSSMLDKFRVTAFFFTKEKCKARTKEGRIIFGDIEYYKRIYYMNTRCNIRWNSNDLITDTDKINKANTPIGFKEGNSTISFKDYNPFKELALI